MKLRKFILLNILFSVIGSCKNSNKHKIVVSESNDKMGVETITDSLKPDSLESFDQKELTPNENTNQKKLGKIINPAFPLKYIFGIWTTDLTGPHADFQIDSTSWYIVDSEEDGNLPYLLNYDSLIVFSDGLKIKYKILKADKDSLILADESGIDRNVRWKN